MASIKQSGIKGSSQSRSLQSGSLGTNKLGNTLNHSTNVKKDSGATEKLAKDLVKMLGAGVDIAVNKGNLSSVAIKRGSTDLRIQYIESSNAIAASDMTIDQKKEAENKLTTDLHEKAYSTMDLSTKENEEIYKQNFSDKVKPATSIQIAGYDGQLVKRDLRFETELADRNLSLFGTADMPLKDYAEENQQNLKHGTTDMNELETKWIKASGSLAETFREESNIAYGATIKTKKQYIETFVPSYDSLTSNGKLDVEQQFQNTHANFLKQESANGISYINYLSDEIAMDPSAKDIEELKKETKNVQGINGIHRLKALDMLQSSDGSFKITDKSSAAMAKKNMNGLINAKKNLPSFSMDPNTVELYTDKLYNSETNNLNTINAYINNIQNMDSNYVSDGEKVELASRVRVMYKNQQDKLYSNMANSLSDLSTKQLSENANDPLLNRSKENIISLAGSDSSKRKLQMGFALSKLSELKRNSITIDQWNQLDNIMQGGVSDNELAMVKNVDINTAYNIATNPTEANEAYEMNKALVFMGFTDGEAEDMIKDTFQGSIITSEGMMGGGFTVRSKSKLFETVNTISKENLMETLNGTILHINDFNNNEVRSSIDDYGVYITDDENGNQVISSRTKNTGFYDYIATVKKEEDGSFNIIDMSAYKYSDDERILSGVK